MPKNNYREFTEKLEKASAFSFRTVEGRVGRNYAKVFIHNLKKKGRITELIKGWYSFRNSPYLITIPLGEAYVGLGTAAFIHGAWDQVPNVDVLTTKAPRKIKVGERIIAGRKVITRKISRKMYFGYETKYIEEAKDWIRVSDPEKTLIDLIYYNYPFINEILPSLMKKINPEKLKEYMERIKCLRGSKKIISKIKKANILAEARKERNQSKG
jgi:predicted transcriptional regulator of viral defense system